LLRNEVGDISPKRRFALRRIYSVGEPLNPEVINWAERTFDAQVYDNYWQTETGSFVIANRPNLAVKRGAMGKAVEGVQVSIIDNAGNEVPNGVVGDIAIRPTLTSFFKGYWNFPEATRACFRAGWYITRDRGRRDADGYFWFMARNDDVITCQAQRIGPFEVENALLSHPAIAESAAVGAKDEMTTEHVKAFVVLRKDFTASRKLAQEIAAHVRAQLSPLATPREIEFCADLPKTRSGKIQRNQLRRKGNFDNDKIFIIE
jgi:acetyl-CoA synthetase